jgi:hypothetical protein
MPGDGLTHGRQQQKKLAAVTPGSAGSSCIPRAMVLRLIRALVSAKSARMCERAALNNRPSLDLSPYVLKGHRA